MSNTFGQLFRLTTCGESHGPAYMGIIDGCPSGLALTLDDIQIELNRRRPGQSAFVSERREQDEVEIISGVFEGKTTGMPIGLLIKNTDQRERDYTKHADTFRPGHADYTYYQKYGVRDPRGGGRASARETMLWVAAGAIAKKYLREKQAIQIYAYLAQMGNIKVEQVDLNEINQNPFFCPDKNKTPQLEKSIEALRHLGDSIGARVNVIAENVPVGLGEPVFNKLNAAIAHALMSINAVKGVEIGDGFAVIEQRGSEHRDEITPEGFLSNHAGGILGGISSGQRINASMAIKPASSIRILGKTVDTNNEPATIETSGRHDPCVGIRAVPVAEAMMALVLIDFILRNKAP